MSSSFIKKSNFDIYCGPMMGGKSANLLAAVEPLLYIPDISIVAFKPKVDTRDGNCIKSRALARTIDAYLVGGGREEDIFEKAMKSDVILLDEAQFFDKKIVGVVEQLMKNEKYIIAAGLDLDYMGKPFGPMGDLMAIATYIKKCVGVCQHNNCGEPGTRTQLLINGEAPTYVGKSNILIEDNSLGAQKMTYARKPVP